MPKSCIGIVPRDVMGSFDTLPVSSKVFRALGLRVFVRQVSQLFFANGRYLEQYVTDGELIALRGVLVPSVELCHVASDDSLPDAFGWQQFIGINHRHSSSPSFRLSASMPSILSITTRK